MAIPPTATAFAGTLDPHEKLDWRVSFYLTVEDGEVIATGTWTLEVLAEGAALGLTIMTGDGRDPALTSDSIGILFWLEIDALFQDDASFDEGGLDLPMRVTFNTDAAPSRTRQRTFLVHVEQL
jgi:hypothetical protein